MNIILSTIMSFASKSRETSYCDDYPPPVLVPIAPCTPTVSTSTTTCSTTEDAENHISSNIDFAPYIMDLLLEDLVFEESIDFMWLLRSGQMSIDEFYDLKPIESFMDKKLHKKNANYMLKPISCNICGEQVAGSRYAPHLERCMNGGKRGSRRYFDSLQDSKPSSKLSKTKKDSGDPFPESFVVSIKLKDGMPVPHGRRVGVSMEEFERSVVS